MQKMFHDCIIIKNSSPNCRKLLNENKVNLEDSMTIKKLVNKQIVNCPYCEWSEKFENLKSLLENNLQC
jgi:hypothetical protein